jgi:hypothetical protein
LGIMAKRNARSQIGNNYDQFNTQPLKLKKKKSNNFWWKHVIRHWNKLIDY